MKLGTKIKRIIKMDSENFKVSLEYTNGFKGAVDLSFIFMNPEKKPLVLEILRGVLFKKCFVESGSLAWPNGYELCADAIYSWIQEQKKKNVKRNIKKMVA